MDDTANPSKVIVIEVAQALSYVDGKTTAAWGARLHGRFPEESNGEAAFHPGDRFDHKDAPFVMAVLSGSPEEPCQLDIRFRGR